MTHVVLVAYAALSAGAFSQQTAPGKAEEPSEFIRLQPMRSGLNELFKVTQPQKIQLSAEPPAALVKAPDRLMAPLYGLLPIGVEAQTDAKRGYLVIVDEPEGRAPRLYVDANRNGDLTDDPPAAWETKTEALGNERQVKHHVGGADIELVDGDRSFTAHLMMYRYDKSNPRSPELKNALFYYRDYGYQGTMTIGGAQYKALLVDDSTKGDFRHGTARLLVDVNSNGEFDKSREMFKVQDLVTVGGTNYRIVEMASDGSQFRLAKSPRPVTATAASKPDHKPGKTITPFQAKTMDGKTVDFPADYKGKLVMLDFWATWCRPCMLEVPELVSVYEEYHGQGLEILGVSLDGPAFTAELKATLEKKKMTWPQIYDGKKWDAQIAKLYRIRSIPAAFLVDGDSGEIMASGNSLRGESLKHAVAGALVRKKSAAGK